MVAVDRRHQDDSQHRNVGCPSAVADEYYESPGGVVAGDSVADNSLCSKRQPVAYSFPVPAPPSRTPLSFFSYGWVSFRSW